MREYIGYRQKNADRMVTYLWNMAWLSNSTRTNLIGFKAEADDMQSVLLLRPCYHSDGSVMVLVASADDKVSKWVRTQKDQD